jgi:hypothetical protein
MNVASDLIMAVSTMDSIILTGSAIAELQVGCNLSHALH